MYLITICKVASTKWSDREQICHHLLYTDWLGCCFPECWINHIFVPLNFTIFITVTCIWIFFSIDVKSALDYKSQETCTCKDASIQGYQETYNLFSPSLFNVRKISLWTEKDLTTKAEELYEILKNGKYADSLNRKTGRQAIHEAELRSLYESKCTCQDSDLNCDEVILDLPNFCQDNELHSGKYLK